MEPHLRPPGKIKETKLEFSKESLLNLHRYSWVSSDADTKTFILADKQGPASTRYSTRTRIFLSYSNSTRTKHYSDRVASSKTPRISTIIQKQPARRYFRIITANPDIQMQPSMEKMSSDLNVKKMEDVSKLYFKNYMTHKFISSCPCSSATSGLSGR